MRPMPSIRRFAGPLAPLALLTAACVAPQRPSARQDGPPGGRPRDFGAGGFGDRVLLEPIALPGVWLHHDLDDDPAATSRSYDGFGYGLRGALGNHDQSVGLCWQGITADDAGNLHVIWRDQRSSPPGVSPSQQGDGDLFVSDLVNGAWSAPVQVTGLDADGPDNVAWPHMDADGDRLVAIWSVYTQRATADPTRRADRVVWSSRPIAEPDGWAPAASLVEPQNGEVGSQLVDLVADPRGGLVAVSTRLNRGSNTVNGGPSLLLLPRGAGAWSPELSLAGGNLGYFPTVAVTADGVAYVAFNLGTGRRVEVGVVGATLDSGVVGPVVSPTAGESGEHGRPSLAIGTDGKPWIVYMHGETNSNSVELRASRDVAVPLQPGG